MVAPAIGLPASSLTSPPITVPGWSLSSLDAGNRIDCPERSQCMKIGTRFGILAVMPRLLTLELDE